MHERENCIAEKKNIPERRNIYINEEKCKTRMNAAKHTKWSGNVQQEKICYY